MANVKKEFDAMEATEFRRNNGVVARAICTMYRRGWFKVRELLQTLSAYNMSVDDILDAIDYMEDRTYLTCRDSDTKIAVRSCDAEVGDVELKLTADGKLLGYAIAQDDGIDL